MRGGSMLTLTMLTRGSGITSANFEGGGIKTRGQTNMDNPAEYEFIRNRIVPLGIKQIVF